MLLLVQKLCCSGTYAPPSKGLVNGSLGTVVDIIYKEGDNAPCLPLYLIIDFPENNGYL